MANIFINMLTPYNCMFDNVDIFYVIMKVKFPFAITDMFAVTGYCKLVKAVVFFSEYVSKGISFQRTALEYYTISGI